LAANLGLEYFSGSVEGIAGEQHALDALAVSTPLHLDLVEIAMVRDQGLVGLLVRPVAHPRASRFFAQIGAGLEQSVLRVNLKVSCQQ
jgi:hypothetical protein